MTTGTKLPPGLERGTFERAIKKMAAIVGSQWVFTSADDIDLYRDPYSPSRGQPDEIIPSGAVAPENIEEVRAIMRVANEHRIPIYPVSTGRNLGYGGAAPVLSGSLVLDLKRMNRIIEVNEDLAYAIVEPGVSYFDLYRHLQDNGIKLWIDFPGPGWGSPLGNALDRGVGGYRFETAAHWTQHCGLEVVLANGELVRTGMGAMPNAKIWASFKYGLGPDVDGLFSQSNFGVVTKMGFRMTREPQALMTGVVTIPRHSDIHKAVPIFRQLIDQEIIRGPFALLSPGVEDAYQIDYPENGPFWKMMDQAEQPSDEQFEAYIKTTGKPAWVAPLRFMGIEEVAQAQWSTVKKWFAAIDGVSFQEMPVTRFPLSEEQRAAIPMKEWEPSLGAFAMGTRAQGGWPTASTGHLFFSPMHPLTSQDILKARFVFNRVLRKHKVKTVDANLALIANGFSGMVMGLRLTEDAAQNARVRAAYLDLVKVGATLGYAEYRTHAMFMDEVVSGFSFNNHALLRLAETLKDAIDPNGIISAGRYGIWPKYLRKSR
jgi:4-cresol dehydrogenase (hydroxylating)